MVYVDQQLDFDLEDHSAEVRQAAAGVRVAFFWTNELWPLTQLANILQITHSLRSWMPEIKIVVGGTFVSACPSEMLQVECPVDYFIQGFGEMSAQALIHALDGEIGFEDVPGLVWRDGDDYRANPVAQKQPDAAANTNVMYRQLDMQPYIHTGGIFGNDQPTLTVGTGQGCGKRCDFCYWRNLNISLLSPLAIVDLVEFLRDRYGVRQFHLAELDFFANPRRPLEMARLWKERLPDCIWFSLCSPIDGMRLSDKDWDTLAAGGCAKLELGTESGSDRVITAIGKHHTPAHVVHIVTKLVERNMHSMHNVIFGFVGETARDRQATVALINRLSDVASTRITFAVRLYQPTPGTPMGDVALESDLAAPRNLDDLASVRPGYDQASARTMPWLSEWDETEVKRMVGYFLPIAISRAVYPHLWQRCLYRALRSLARWRLRRNWLTGSLDQTLYRRLLDMPLGFTYRP